MKKLKIVGVVISVFASFFLVGLCFFGGMAGGAYLGAQFTTEVGGGLVLNEAGAGVVLGGALGLIGSLLAVFAFYHYNEGRIGEWINAPSRSKSKTLMLMV